MSTFRVWAPFAERVELLIHPNVGARHASPLRSADAERLPMRQGGSGWWTIEASSPLPAGRGPGGEVPLDYAYLVDGEGPFPDPRSPWQPGGVDGPSRTVDHAGFAWQHDDWPDVDLADAVIYELHVGTFTPGGSFDRAIEHLDHLVNLGITHVEVMPVAHFSGARGWGYDGVDIYAPHQAYGGPEALNRLVDACHGKGLRVLMDVVYNHLGPAGNYTERFGPYFTDRYHTPWGKAINYDQAYSNEVRRWVVDNALMWLRDYRFDGVRLDAVHAILDQSATHILEQLAMETRALEYQTGRHYDLIAESDLNDPKLVRAPERGGYGLDAAWSDDFHHALHALLSGESAGYYEDFGGFEHLAAALQRVYVYDGRYSEYRRRTHGRSIGDVPATRFVFASQNHDQVGNRAVGERLVHLAGYERAKIAAAVLIMAPGVPLLFQGEEWGASTPFQYFTAHEDAALGSAVSEGRRREFAAFGWDPASVPDPQDPATFERSRLNWNEIDREPHAEMLSWYRALIALRRASPELRDGDLTKVQIAYDDGAGWLRMSRGTLTLILNLGPQASTVEVVAPSSIRLASRGEIEAVGASVVLPPDSVAILETNT